MSKSVVPQQMPEMPETATQHPMLESVTEEQGGIVKRHLQKALQGARGMGLDRGGPFGISSGFESAAGHKQGVTISHIYLSDGDCMVEIRGNTAESHQKNPVTGEFPPESIPAQLQKAGFDIENIKLQSGGTIGFASAAGYQLMSMTWRIPQASFSAALKQELVDGTKPAAERALGFRRLLNFAR